MHHFRSTRQFAASIFLPVVLLAAPLAGAQIGGNGAISGTVLDSTGAVVPNASVVALDVKTGITTTRTSTGAGLYTVGPLIPGTYTVTVSAPGFSTFKQENITVDALNTLGLNVNLQTGGADQTITVSDAPPPA